MASITRQRRQERAQAAVQVQRVYRGTVARRLAAKAAALRSGKIASAFLLTRQVRAAARQAPGGAPSQRANGHVLFIVQDIVCWLYCTTAGLAESRIVTWLSRPGHGAIKPTTSHLGRISI